MKTCGLARRLEGQGYRSVPMGYNIGSRYDTDADRDETITSSAYGPFSGNASIYSKAEIDLQAIELLETPEKSLVEHGAKILRETTTRGALT